MSNSYYPLGLEYFAAPFLTDNVVALLVTSAYTPAATDKFISDIPSPAIVSRSGNLSGKTITGGVFNCSNFTISLVPNGHVIKYVVFAKDTGTDATSRLLFIDDTGVNLPTTTDGADLQYQVSTSPNKLGALGGTVVS